MTLDATVYDAWNRLISVQGRGSGKITATYRYNGLGHRITWHDDATASGLPPDGSDPVYHVVYTEDWRMLAVYRGSDANPKERHVPHFAGLNGYGNAAQGGIDGEILRDRDASTAWAAAADGLDERRYICQNWRGDVSAIITDGGIMIEWTKYTAYGEPIGLPTGDVDSDGDWDSTDSTAILGHGGAYDARYDVNLDGVIDADDAGDAVNYNGGGTYTIGSGKVSGANTANRKGYAGYEHDRVMPAFLTHVRHRAYRMDLGRWMQPDPLGYVDGVNRLAYLRSSPVKYSDPLGLWNPWDDPNDDDHPSWLPTDWPHWPWKLPCTTCPGSSPGSGQPNPPQRHIPGTGWQIGGGGSFGMCAVLGTSPFCVCISVEITVSAGKCCCIGLEGLRCCEYTMIEICIVAKVGLCGLTQPPVPRFRELEPSVPWQRQIRTNCGEVVEGCQGEFELFGQVGPFRMEWNPATPDTPPEIIIPVNPLEWLRFEAGGMGCMKCRGGIRGNCACTTEM
ncbi:MAG: RHS repeat-associated core domain-containing protein [Phycisphaerales bacterium]